MEFVKFKLMVLHNIELSNVRVEECLGFAYLRLKITEDTVLLSNQCWNIFIFLD